MSKLIFAINTTLDGCCDHTKSSGSNEIFEYFGDLLRDADTLVYGRKTYELMIPYWPDIAKNHSGPTNPEIEFARAFDAIHHIVVFSKTLEQASGKNTRIVRTNLHEEIVNLKQQQGKNILIGGLNILSQLIDSGLVDEYHFVIHPRVVGEGRRLLDGIDLPNAIQLRFIESKVFKSGIVVMRYSKN